LAQADIFLNTSNVDNTPVSVIEAMATGLCIVSTEVGGVAYLCARGKEALLVPVDDANAMASAVRSILTDPSLSKRLSRAARAKAEGFGWSEVLPKWEGLLNLLQPQIELGKSRNEEKAETGKLKGEITTSQG
jgi:glycosyltransferase involved in cell wall biosynthesis